jgi:light-regulated signal transduction histidine kinase (bacteriophytochrome)
MIAVATIPASDEVAAFVLDMSALKAAQNALARRTAELARSNLDLQQFAYAASHDLREPLRTIATYVGLLSRRMGGDLDPGTKEFMGYIEDGVRHMRTLIDDLLEYSRVADTTNAGFADVDCNAAVRQALRNLETKVERACANIAVHPLPTIRGRESRIVALFQNLVGNAIAYSTEQPRVSISATLDAEGWRFSVADNGIGIAPEHHDVIFGVFRRLHARDAYPGTGIGLAICRRIVEQHGGRIWVESDGPGKGATFHFTIPG